MIRRIAVLVLFFHYLTSAEAHDIYTGLTDTSGRPCCTISDCRPAQYRISLAGVQMLVQDEWIVVPAPVIQYRLLRGDTGETAGGHWCGFTELRNLERTTASPVAFCAVLPPKLSEHAQ